MAAVIKIYDFVVKETLELAKEFMNNTRGVKVITILGGPGEYVVWFYKWEEVKQEVKN